MVGFFRVYQPINQFNYGNPRRNCNMWTFRNFLRNRGRDRKSQLVETTAGTFSNLELCHDTMICNSCGEYCEDGMVAYSNAPDDNGMKKCTCECHIPEVEDEVE